VPIANNNLNIESSSLSIAQQQEYGIIEKKAPEPVKPKVVVQAPKVPETKTEEGGEW
jgi:hypothetical protein